MIESLRTTLAMQQGNDLSALICIAWLIIAVIGPWITPPHDVGKVVSHTIFAPMSLDFPLGTDYTGPR
ncbi:hypothetical protein P4S72_27565 [Vibrio sp. PP-XX7]